MKYFLRFVFIILINLVFVHATSSNEFTDPPSESSNIYFLLTTDISSVQSDSSTLDTTTELFSTTNETPDTSTTTQESTSDSNSSSDLSSSSTIELTSYSNSNSPTEIPPTVEPTIEPSTTTESTTISPCETTDSPVQNLIITPAHFSLFLEWNHPKLDICKYSYKIKIANEIEHTTTAFKYTVTGLKPCLNYNVSVITVFYNDDKGSVSQSSKTLGIDLEAVENLKVENTTYGISINWNPPEKSGSCVDKYHYEVLQDDLIIWKSFTKETSLTVFQPNLCVDYTFIIYPSIINDQKFGPEKNCTYSSFITNDAPRKGSKIVFDDEVVLKWQKGDFTCGIRRFYINCTSEHGQLITHIGQIEDDELTVTLRNLPPFTNYACCGFLANKYLNSSCSEILNIQTKPKVPDKPTFIHISENKGKSLNISWGHPKLWNGQKEGFHFTVKYLGPTYDVYSRCKNEFHNTSLTRSFNSDINHYLFDEIDYSIRYKISICAMSNGGKGEVIEEEFTTSDGNPETPVLEKANLIYADWKNYSAILIVKWKPPCKMNGELQEFWINFIGIRKEHDNDQEHNRTVSAMEDEFEFINLKPAYTYTVQIIAKNQHYWGTSIDANVTTKDGVPTKSETSILNPPSCDNVLDPTSMANIDILSDLFDSSMGDILYYAVIVALAGCEEQSKYDFYDAAKWPAVATGDGPCRNTSRAYQATEKEWNPFQENNRVNLYTFTIGSDPNCTTEDVNIDFCNRPLTPSSNYSVKIRGFTKIGFSDTGPLYFATAEPADDGVNVGLVVGLVVGILAIAFIIAATLFYTNGKVNFSKWPRMESQSHVSPTPLPVPIRKFDAHYKKMTENPGKIKNEFQLLTTISSDVTLSTKTALLPANKKKNRYINILPYDETRVVLKADSTSSDYINASYIQGYSGTVEFIATQGPTEATCPAFWQMILEQNVKLIVMLTQCVETGREKCYKYFPDLEEEFEFINNIKVEGVQEELLTVYNLRTYKLTKDNIVKKITHVQFNLWPDFGVPENVSQIIDFLGTLNDIKIKKPGMVVMHCSAGVGRTGTLIAVDVLLQTIRDKRKVDIFGTVLNLRKQRMIMVQSEKQYEFLYKCVHYAITKNGNISKAKLNQISESNML